MNAAQLNIIKDFGNYSPASIRAALIGAIAVTTPVPFKKVTMPELREHFMKQTANYVDAMFKVNEMIPINVDLIKLDAFEVYSARYLMLVRDDWSLLEIEENLVRKTWKDCVTDFPEDTLIKRVCDLLRQSLPAPESNDD